ncbi:MAG: deoxyribodipyrimidine photolyase [Acidobacteriota bacterium]
MSHNARNPAAHVALDASPHIPHQRLAYANNAAILADRDYVLYWMIAARRPRWNFALDHAIGRARELGKPLVVFEPLRVGYPWASDRLHRFVVDGMQANARVFDDAPALYYPWLESEEGEGQGLLEAMAKRAAVVVTDDWPCFFLPRMVAAAADALDVRVETVDSCGLLPLRCADKIYKRAVDLRRHLQSVLHDHLLDRPRAEPFDGVDLPSPDGLLPDHVTARWPSWRQRILDDAVDLATFPIDHLVRPIDTRGGCAAGAEQLADFIYERLPRYLDDRLDLEHRATSELSGHLHFGHLGAHQVFDAVAAREDWSPGRLGERANGAREGWWGMSAEAESFLDQLVTWRELGHNLCHHRTDYADYDSLPGWARQSLAEHSGDERPDLYDLETLEHARTHDEIWNAAQRELLVDGRIHNYLRMLWAKKILEWSPSPRAAAERMIHLNDKYAIDGRDPNSYSGIFWCLGRYDRAWGPERPIFGKIRYMSSDSTRRKTKLGPYLETYGPLSTAG